MPTPDVHTAAGPRVVVIGGGTGSFTLLSGLKHYVRNITALVNMSDNGGSTGVLRDELGVLPPGDIRQCLTALSEVGVARELFNYRFEDGSLNGHSFGNLFLAAAEKVTGSFEEGVHLASKMLLIDGGVEPITADNVNMRMMTDNGAITEGEYNIATTHFGSTRPEIWLEPQAIITDRSRTAILNADLIVIAQGNLYGTIAPALVVHGVADAISASPARTVYIANLVTKHGQTDGFTVVDYADEIERFAQSPLLDYVVYNENLPSPELLDRYAAEGEHPVTPGPAIRSRHWEPVGANLLSGNVPHPISRADKIASTRTLIRHDSDALARILMRIYFR